MRGGTAKDHQVQQRGGAQPLGRLERRTFADLGRTAMSCDACHIEGHNEGVLFEKTHPLQPMTMHFRVGNVRRRPDLSDRCRASLVRAHEAGELKMFYGPGLMFHFAPDEVYVHATRVAGDATDPER